MWSGIARNGSNVAHGQRYTAALKVVMANGEFRRNDLEKNAGTAILIDAKVRLNSRV